MYSKASSLKDDEEREQIFSTLKLEGMPKCKLEAIEYEGWDETVNLAREHAIDNHFQVPVRCRCSHHRTNCSAADGVILIAMDSDVSREQAEVRRLCTTGDCKLPMGDVLEDHQNGDKDASKRPLLEIYHEDDELTEMLEQAVGFVLCGHLRRVYILGRHYEPHIKWNEDELWQKQLDFMDMLFYALARCR